MNRFMLQESGVFLPDGKFVRGVVALKGDCVMMPDGSDIPQHVIDGVAGEDRPPRQMDFRGACPYTCRIIKLELDEPKPRAKK